ncbi:fibrinogen-related protein 3.1 [Elysia marginata]|uniref:Fibrinogen-related protein 3.1 n=1 Tax=Elysia marginata TaxID=1093978 RepID=A0AAV4JXR8_9GAST|nr:fibrinogen-related protein 3.1 [Elysia marginata]
MGTERNWRSVCVSLLLAALFLTTCDGQKFNLDRENLASQGARNLCGVLTCEENIDVSVSSSPGADPAGSSVLFSSITHLSVFERISSTLGKREVQIGSISTQSPTQMKVSNGRKVNGLLEPERASIRVELVKMDDCKAEFVCKIRGLDTYGKEVMSSATLLQQQDKGDKFVPDMSVMPDLSLAFLNSIKQLITQSANNLENRVIDKITFLTQSMSNLENSVNNKITSLTQTMSDVEKAVEDKILQQQNNFNYRMDSFEQGLDAKLDRFENRLEDKIDGNNNLNKLIQLDVKVSSELAKFRDEAKTDISDSLKVMTKSLQDEQRRVQKNISRFEETLNATSDRLAYMENDLESLGNYGQMNILAVKNDTEAMLDILRSMQVSSQCDHKDVKPTACYRGMGDAVVKDYPPYVQMTDTSLNREILCDTETAGGGWIVIQRRVNGDVDFYRNWTDYKNGFGDLSGDFWLGNDAIHLLTSQHPYELRIDMTDDGEKLFANYSSFEISDESDNYRLTLGSYSGTVGEDSADDGFSYHNGQPFSTFDNDNENDSRHCAENYKGGWWYKKCYNANLNGEWKSRTEQGMKWYVSFNPYRYISSTEMKIRRI